MLATLNIVIGLVFVLLLFSLLTSTVMEVIAAMLSLRSKHLRYTLENMLGEKMDDFLRHPLFRQLSYATNQRARISTYYLPGYVSKDTFTSILEDLMDANHKEVLAEKIKNLDEGDLKRMMQFMYRQAGGDPTGFKAQSGKWFDDVMERSTDWYKRTLKWWLFGVGLVLAAVFNADTIQMYQNISASATTQDFLIEMAANYTAKTDTVTAPNLQLSVEQSIGRLDSALQNIEYIRSPLGLGWSESKIDGNSLWWWLTKLAGIALTGIAVTFGAPFWFDLLRKLLSLRGGASIPAKSAETQPAAAPSTPSAAGASVPEVEKPEIPVSKPSSGGKSKPVG